MKMKDSNVLLYMAQSLNAKIARENYQEDFLSSLNWEEFLDFAEEIWCIVGRKTYEEVMDWDDYTFADVEAQCIVVSNNTELNIEETFTLANSPKDALEKAAEAGYEEVLLTGGAGLNSSFLKEKLVDEIIINVEPFILGKGIPVFSGENFEYRLEFKEVRKLKEGIVQLRYNI